MTPAEQAGLKVGDKIRVLNNYPHRVEVGSIVTLVRDDGSNCPYFFHEKEYKQFCWHAFEAPAKWEKIDSSLSYTEDDLKKLCVAKPYPYYESIIDTWAREPLESLDSIIAALMIARLRIKEGRV